jgi:hypothetical protein
MKHTPTTVRARGRKLEQRNINITTVLARMRKGARLHLQFTTRGPQWWCGDLLVDPDIARAVTSNPHVESADVALFGVAGQTFWWND